MPKDLQQVKKKPMPKSAPPSAIVYEERQKMQGTAKKPEKMPKNTE